MIGMMSRSAVDIAMYSASVVESMTCDCSLDAKMIGHPAKDMNHPLHDFDVLG